LQEVHLLHKFQRDLYGEELKIIIGGYIRPEKDFSSLGNGHSFHLDQKVPGIITR